VAVLLALNP
jgi:hypothetical protein